MRRNRNPGPVLAADVVAALVAAEATLATAESLTGGRLAALVTGVPGASACYLGGAVTYATALKVSLLGVPASLVETRGVVSAECALAMARGVQELTGATHALATTGVAGPDPQEGKPVGTVYVALTAPTGVRALSLELVGDRDTIQRRTCEEALSTLLDQLRGEQPVLR